MTGWIISWIIVGIVTWPMEILLLGLKTFNKYGSGDVYDTIGDRFLTEYNRSMFPNDKSYKNPGLIGNIWSLICVVIVWPFDRLAMYLHWRDACKSVGLQQDRKGS